jgi:TatA/E family protein of Tat protein translocase
MFGLGFQELLLILVVALLIFGPSKLPEVGKAIGRAISEFKKATQEVSGENQKKDD